MTCLADHPTCAVVLKVVFDENEKKYQEQLSADQLFWVSLPDTTWCFLGWLGSHPVLGQWPFEDPPRKTGRRGTFSFGDGDPRFCFGFFEGGNGLANFGMSIWLDEEGIESAKCPGWSMGYQWDINGIYLSTNQRLWIWDSIKRLNMDTALKRWANFVREPRHAVSAGYDTWQAVRQGLGLCCHTAHNSEQTLSLCRFGRGDGWVWFAHWRFECTSRWVEIRWDS